MKKIIVIALLSCLVLGAAFAEGLKVGANAGYGSLSLGMFSKDTADSYLLISENGFYGEASLEFDASESLGLKAAFGVLAPSKAYLTVRNGSDDKAETEEIPADEMDTMGLELKPIFTGYLGLQFNAELAKTLSLGFGAGLDLYFGGEGDDFNLAIGAGAEATASFNLSESLSLNVGGKFGYYFYNTDSSMKESAETLNCDFRSFSWKAYAGATIAL